MRRPIIGFLVFCGIGILGVTTVFGARKVHTVSGGGTIEVPNGLVTYSFNAHIDESGNVSGQANVHHPAPSFAKRHIKITCMAVDGNSVWLGGIITHSTYSSDYYGKGIVWRVIDNGEGENALPDEVASVYSGRDPNWCLDKYAFFAMYPLSGNVQIH